VTAEVLVIGALVAVASAYAGWRLWKALRGRGCGEEEPGEAPPCAGCSQKCGARREATRRRVDPGR